MVPECYVDGDVANWMADDDEPAGADIAALVVYHPSIGRKAFEAACDWLEYRADARAEALLEAAGRRGFRFGVIDARTKEEAEKLVTAAYGESYLEDFVNDTRMVALARVGAAFETATRRGVSVSPASAVVAVDVIPAKSFRTGKALEHYLHDRRGTWKPSVRLTLQVSLDGPMALVEEAAFSFRLALSECGPVTEWRQRVRPARNLASAARLKLVAG